MCLFSLSCELTLLIFLPPTTPTQGDYSFNIWQICNSDSSVNLRSYVGFFKTAYKYVSANTIDYPI